ncbi:tetratricopeptide repeat protein [Rhodosalinus sp. 5P4]|uniref:tetratricopeptide repeat protein n=1 Tax=Rhodosalinus sp. 5P4 TaxID=3239196 RepID=UPI003523728D
MRRAGALPTISLTLALGACSVLPGAPDEATPFAPAIDPRGEAVDGLVVGHRLMEAGEYELALDAFRRAGARDGLTPEVLSALGSANLGLGRLNQAETLLRRATDSGDAWPEVWNNLGVVLLERGKTAEAVQILRKAYALDDGESDAIRDNLRLALAKLDETAYAVDAEQQNYKLVRRGSSEYLIRRVP